MFRFIKKLFQTIHFPKPKNRGLFGYWNGEENVYSDPIEIETLLTTDPVFVPDRHPSEAANGSQEAYEICLNAYRRAFSVKPYDARTQKGLTRAELVELIFRYDVFVDMLKKNSSGNPILQRCMEPTSTESEKATTSDFADTFSTDAGNSLGKQAKSSAEQSGQ